MNHKKEDEKLNLKNSIKKFGQVYPIIESQFGIIDGRHRKADGGSEIKKCILKDRKDHFIIRFQLNQSAKTAEEIREDKRECIDGLAELIHQRDNISGAELQKKIADEMEISKRTVQRYITVFKSKPRGKQISASPGTKSKDVQSLPNSEETKENLLPLVIQHIEVCPHCGSFLKKERVETGEVLETYQPKEGFRVRNYYRCNYCGRESEERRYCNYCNHVREPYASQEEIKLPEEEYPEPIIIGKEEKK